METLKTYRADLHNHSPLCPNDYKGGWLTTGHEIVMSAISKGIDIFAVTDHFSVGFFEELRLAAVRAHEATGSEILVVPGCELKVRWKQDEVHIVPIFNPISYNDDFEELLSYLGVTPIQRAPKSLPDIVVEHNPYDVVEKVEKLGGFSHIAHIDRYFGAYRLLDSSEIDHFILNAPVAAIDLIDLSLSPLLHERTNGVKHIQCSDSHCVNEMGRRTSQLELDELSFDALKEAFARQIH